MSLVEVNRKKMMTDVVNMEIAITYNFVILRDLKEL